jgi:CRP/FNR family transcriptional regulator, cyclic AMP receptor protein
LTLTHEEIAQMIGSSRETVTRLLAVFGKRQILQMTGSTLGIKNKQGREAIVNNSFGLSSSKEAAALLV